MHSTLSLSLGSTVRIVYGVLSLDISHWSNESEMEWNEMKWSPFIIPFSITHTETIVVYNLPSSFDNWSSSE